VRTPPNLTASEQRRVDEELDAWARERLPEAWVWLREWQKAPRRVFWMLDVRTGRWVEV
jgi:hypothetical protein